MCGAAFSLSRFRSKEFYVPKAVAASQQRVLLSESFTWLHLHVYRCSVGGQIAREQVQSVVHRWYNMSWNNEELLVSLREKHGHEFVSMNDLEHPTSEFMMRYFATVLPALGIDVEGMTNHELLQSLPHADSYRDIRAYSQVYMAVRKIYPVPKYLVHFSILSLMEPKPEDVYYVAVMDNFNDFYYQRISELLEPRIRESNLVKNLVKDKEQLVTELQHQLNDEAAARSKRVIEQGQMESQIQDLNGELKELQLLKQQLEVEASELEETLKKLQEEVKGNRLKLEQMEEKEEAQVQLERLKQKLEILQNRRAEQDSELAEKQSALQEKASRQCFLEECIVLETQATEAVAELLELAAHVEKQKKTSQESKTKVELMIRKLEAVIKTENNLERKEVALQEDTALQVKKIHILNKEMEDLERNIQNALGTVSKLQHDIQLLEAETKCVQEECLQKKQELLLLEQTFQTEHDKLYEKAISIKTDFKEVIKQ